MKKYEVNYYDYNTGAESPVDVIEVEDDYTVEDYISDCNDNMEEPWDTENGEIRFYEIED